MSKITNDVRLNPVWHRMLYSCNHMATVGVKGLKDIADAVWDFDSRFKINTMFYRFGFIYNY